MTTTTARVCYHPLSCQRCRIIGSACGSHSTHDSGHSRCTGQAGRSNAHIAAQVAVEAIANSPQDYDDATRLAVLANGEAEGVADMYLEMIRS